MSALNDIRHEIASLSTAYPRFIVGAAAPEPGEVPVFVFHSIEPKLFESQLQYLRNNGYRTIGLAEYLAIVTGKHAGTGREVLLTIDDARSSVWRYGLPLLRRYECHAALFVIAGWTGDEPSSPRPTLDTVAGPDVDRLRALDPQDQSLCSWTELREMQSSGLVEVSSHTWLHRRVFVSERCTGFIGPDSSAAPFDAAYSPYLLPGCNPWSNPPGEYFGLPLFEDGAVLEARPAWRLRRGVMDECRQVYSELDPEVADWRARMTRRLGPCFTREAFERSGREEILAEIESEIALARDALSSKLGSSDAGDFLCIPFSAGSDDAAVVARRLGVKACFWGVRSGQPSNHVGADPLYLARIKNDFVWRLPGATRRSLARIYSDKVLRRLRGESPY